MAPGDFLVLCADVSAFETRFPNVANVLGNLNFSLGNGGDRVRLFNSRKELVDEVLYDDSAPWPVQADGGGPTLELVRAGSDNAVSASWRASAWISGSPGAPNGPALSEAQPPTLAARLSESEVSLILNAEAARTYWIQTSTDLIQWIDWRLLVGDGMERTIASPRESTTGLFYRVKVSR